MLFLHFISLTHNFEEFHICFIWQLDNYITISQWWKNDKVEKCRGGKISRVEIIAVEIILFSVLSKLFILFFINFVVITTFFTTYNYNKKVVVTTYNLQLQLQLTTWEEYPPGRIILGCYLYLYGGWSKRGRGRGLVTRLKIPLPVNFPPPPPRPIRRAGRSRGGRRKNLTLQKGRGREHASTLRLNYELRGPKKFSPTRGKVPGARGPVPA